jgi:hypothetical protein
MWKGRNMITTCFNETQRKDAPALPAASYS